MEPIEAFPAACVKSEVVVVSEDFHTAAPASAEGENGPERVSNRRLVVILGSLWVRSFMWPSFITSEN